MAPMKLFPFALLILLSALNVFTQTPPLEPGVSLELARWRAAHYSDVRYKLNLTLEKMSPVLKGTMEITVNVSPLPKGAMFGNGLKKDAGPPVTPIVLDWRKIKGFEERSTISNVSVNGKPVLVGASPPVTTGGTDWNDHLVFSEGVVVG